MGERKRILGIDLGIASCGWAVIEVGENEGEIVAAGVRCFDAPLVDKTGEPKSAQRRAARGARRVIRRRRQRMNKVRKLLQANAILPDSTPEALQEALRRVSPKGTHPPITPWTLRAVAYDRVLSNDELAVVLGHIARHRGFRSNSKSEAGANAADETSKMKKAMEATREGLAKYRSFGEMLANDPKFADRKRNRDKDYSHTAKRSDLEDEVRCTLGCTTALGKRRGNGQTGGYVSARRLSPNVRCRTAKSSSANVRSSLINCAPRGARRRLSCFAFCNVLRICGFQSAGLNDR